MVSYYPPISVTGKNFFGFPTPVKNCCFVMLLNVGSMISGKNKGAGTLCSVSAPLLLCKPQSKKSEPPPHTNKTHDFTHAHPSAAPIHSVGKYLICIHLRFLLSQSFAPSHFLDFDRLILTNQTKKC